MTPERIVGSRDSAPLILAMNQESEQRPTDADDNGHGNVQPGRVAKCHEAEADGLLWAAGLTRRQRGPAGAGRAWIETRHLLTRGAD